MNKLELSQAIKRKAEEIGFLSCGISKAGFLKSEASHLENWLKNGLHGSMSWMENNFDKRLDPTKLVDGAKSVISVLINYFPEKDLFENSELKISKYAYGNDYHTVVKDNLNILLEYMRAEIGEIVARCFTDSAPVLDKAWAERAGLGWIGKNGNLISTKAGSFFFIGEIICDVDLEYDHPPKADHCGTCTRCIDACPTGAIIKPQLVDGSKCISYLTIELKDELIPAAFAGKMDNWIFGCDVCQDVCPWNRFSTPTKISAFEPLDGISQTDFNELTQEGFAKLFEYSPLKRPGFQGLTRNVSFAKKKEA